MIKIMNFQNVEIRDVYDEEGKLVIPNRALEDMYYILTHPEEKQELVEKNFRIGNKEYGLKRLKKCLKTVFDDYGDEIRACRKRIKKSKISYSV